MKDTVARILVAADDEAEADVVCERLRQDFESVRSMPADESGATVFTEFEPTVLVLAIKGISRAEHFFLGLFRSGATSPSSPCRTILLCSKEEVPIAFDLCKKGYFDDYVLHWPLPYDGMRLAMSVWLGCRDSALPTRGDAPDTRELVAHVKSLAAVDSALNAQFSAEDRALLEPHLSQTRKLAEKVRLMRLLVMVVEDDPLACQVIGHLLRDQPVDLVFAASGPAALLILRRQRPDLILMDIRLPGMDGVSVTRTIKTMHAGIPIVMLTGSAKREIVSASMAAGAAGFLVKPVTSEALLDKLQQFGTGATSPD